MANKKEWWGWEADFMLIRNVRCINILNKGFISRKILFQMM